MHRSTGFREPRLPPPIVAYKRSSPPPKLVIHRFCEKPQQSRSGPISACRSIPISPPARGDSPGHFCFRTRLGSRPPAPNLLRRRSRWTSLPPPHRAVATSHFTCCCHFRRVALLEVNSPKVLATRNRAPSTLLESLPASHRRICLPGPTEDLGVSLSFISYFSCKSLDLIVIF